ERSHVGGAVRVASDDPGSVSIELKEPAVTTFVGMDLHRAQITYNALNTDSGEVRTGRICPANRATVRAFLAGLSGSETVVAVEAMTGWRFIAEECARAGVDVRLAEPAETRQRQERKRRAKTDKLDARLLRELLVEGRLPESWIPPEHILDLRAKVRLRKTLVSQRTQWLQRVHAVLFHHGVPVQPGRLARLDARSVHEQLADLQLPEVAEQQITVALRMVEHLNDEVHALDLELERFARRQPGCRALMGHYGIGLRVRCASPRWAPLAPRLTAAALGRLRSCAMRRATKLTRPRLTTYRSRSAWAQTARRSRSRANCCAARTTRSANSGSGDCWYRNRAKRLRDRRGPASSMVGIRRDGLSR
ncbi:MAG: transposase, partial [Actinobacteria bacterium]|nr:transposase [Actinomycetota bacterium]